MNSQEFLENCDEDFKEVEIFDEEQYERDLDSRERARDLRSWGF